MINATPLTKLKRAVRTLTWPAILLENFALNPDSWLRTSGWIASVKNGYPCKQDGSVIPWMNYSIVAFLEERLRSDLVVFEYGCGYSTLFFAERVKHVTAVEHDETWLDLVREHAPSNVTALLRPLDMNGDYCRTINELDGAFDIVVVDGRDRVNCVRMSLPRLSPSGVIILDDSHRDRYSEALDIARDGGFKVLSMIGVKPTGKRPGRTSILYRENNCLGI
jgi:hypothetical protein